VEPERWRGRDRTWQDNRTSSQRVLQLLSPPCAVGRGLVDADSARSAEVAKPSLSSGSGSYVAHDVDEALKDSEPQSSKSKSRPVQYPSRSDGVIATMPTSRR
jgi:hypothetical protein